MSRATRAAAPLAPTVPQTPLAAPGATSSPPPAVRAAAVLARCRELTRPALVDAVGRLDPWSARMAAYALGWRDPGGAPDPMGSGGKGVRQALAVLSAEAVGASAATALPAAVAVELVHTFSLLHDDIMDGDPVRRRRPAVWRAYGVGPAVLAGDALHALAVQSLAEAPGDRAPAAVRHLSRTLSALVRGQADDLRFEELPWTGPDAPGVAAYRAMAEHKTGSLLGCAAALGAELGGAPKVTVAALDQAGRHLGVAFQAVDDLLGIWGDPALTGKPVHGDLRQRKKTYPVLAALAGSGPARRELAALLDSAEPLEGAAAARAAALVDEAGGRAATRTEASTHLDAARACLRAACPDPAAARDLDALAGALLDRVW
ncbi:polyprenyl synthetase family protein [Streptomyces sp. BBFR102]|uniref:polyprenyl synthetase family protein n=1 Tax=Streptomyces sp. BBFR102 TaxID=3448171 RepID=UPI003F5379C0